MLSRVSIKNFRSIYKSSVNLKPFTLLIGANGAGKSNFLTAVQNTYRNVIQPHYNHSTEQTWVSFTSKDGSVVGRGAEPGKILADSNPIPNELQNVRIFRLDPQNSGKPEQLEGNPKVDEAGGGVVRVLDSLKTGDREDLFDKIEEMLRKYIPEIEKLSFIPGGMIKQLQVRERHIKSPIPVSELSEGTQLVIILLTILFQERAPSIICIEDIDRGLHPRLLQKIMELCFDLTANENVPQIIATTHNPYLVDLFKGNEEAVVIVEKKEGYSTFTELSDRLEEMDEGDAPLGELWFSGHLGGVPERR